MKQPIRIFLSQPTLTRERRPTIHCAADGCNNHTRHGKTHCVNHIQSMDYAKSIKKEMSRRSREKGKLTKNFTLGKNSHLVREALAVLWEFQEVTAPGLTRHIDINHQQSAALLRSLSKHGYATVCKNRRGVLRACATFGAKFPYTTI